MEFPSRDVVGLAVSSGPERMRPLLARVHLLALPERSLSFLLYLIEAILDQISEDSLPLPSNV